jgi:coenzyme F420-dependent glucose-6-phosphate dehydrogenase
MHGLSARTEGYAQLVTEVGYALSSEEHEPNVLIDNARRAEEAGFTFSLISDHFHPWTSKQGQSPFVWAVLGGLATRTKTMRFGTGVTCPLIRTHPAIVAQAAATIACMMPGRFFLGVGTGENLNEHVVGAGWPAADVRLDMLDEAIDVMRELWKGEDVTHRGKHFTVEQARLFTTPDEPPPIYVAAAGDTAAKLAGRKGDGLVSTSPNEKTVQTFSSAGGDGKPTIGMLHVCYAASEREARKTAHTWWPNSAIKGELGQELPLPRHFEQAAGNVTEDDVAETMPCGPDADRHIDAIEEYVRAGFENVYVHQVGPDQEGFLRFYEERVLPKVR